MINHFNFAKITPDKTELVVRLIRLYLEAGRQVMASANSRSYLSTSREPTCKTSPSISASSCGKMENCRSGFRL